MLPYKLYSIIEDAVIVLLTTKYTEKRYRSRPKRTFITYDYDPTNYVARQFHFKLM